MDLTTPTRLLAAAAAVLALVAGLAGGARAGTTTRYAISGAHATIAVPSSWKVLDRRTVTNSAAFSRFVDENPALRALATQMRAPNSAIKLMAFDPTRGTFATSVNVVLSGPSAGLTPQQAASSYAREVKAQLPYVLGPIATSVVRLPIGPAVRASYRVRFTSNGRAVTTQTLQYLVLREDTSFVVTLTTLPAEAARRRAAFTAIARSLRLGA